MSSRTGASGLKASQVYPDRYGQAIARHHKKFNAIVSGQFIIFLGKARDSYNSFSSVDTVDYNSAIISLAAPTSTS